MSELTIRGVDLHHDVAGAGPTMIWGHGLTSSRAREDDTQLIDWTRVRRHAIVVRYDARGHGESGSTADPADYHWRALAHDQLALADALGHETYIAGGASMGCATALHAAVLAPERITALVLAIPPTAWATRAAQQQGYELSAQLVEEGQLDVLVNGARATAPPDPLIEVPAWRDGFEQMVRTTDPVRLARIFRGAAATDLPEPAAIAAIDVPTLILCWTGDAGHPFSTAERLAELINGSRISVASTFDQLSRWTDTITTFVDGLA